MSITNLFHWTYYFDSNMGSTFAGFWVWVTLAILLIVGGSIVSVKSKKWNYFYRQVAARGIHISLMLGWFGLALLFFRYQGIPYLAWRLWPALLFIYVLIAGYYLVKFIRVDYPERQQQRGSRAEKDLYLRKFLGK